MMQRLNSGELLSNVLPQFKTLASLENDADIQFLADMLIYGSGKIPEATKPSPKKAANLFLKLNEVEYVEGITFQSLREGIPEGKRLVLTRGTHAIEGELHAKAPSLSLDMTDDQADGVLRQRVLHDETLDVLNKRRSFVYDYASQSWQRNAKEKDYIQLLGPDYRLVLDSIGALNTEVADILTAALDRLTSENPENWALSALGCRNVILRLEVLLWQVQDSEYKSVLSGKTLVVKADEKGAKEKNKLLAYIDANWQVADGINKTLLEEAYRLVPEVYDRGSKGKRIMRRSEAQQLVVDTFRLVDLLQDATGLTPLTSLPVKSVEA
ncbi:MAG: hypothetical protein Q8O40_17590 [Chloroflexota bacterium]|nr:hypothetical protein [Chloroflexota bacterium]